MKYTKKQIKANRKAWIEALRSRKFRQTKGKLKSRNGSYCCLGVACEVAEVPEVYVAGDYIYGDHEVLDFYKKYLSDTAEWGAHPEGYYDRHSSTGLPLAAQEWLGVTEEGPRLASPVVVVEAGEEIEVDSLIDLNDNHGWSFEQIADAVEKYGLKE